MIRAPGSIAKTDPESGPNSTPGPSSISNGYKYPGVLLKTVSAAASCSSNDLSTDIPSGKFSPTGDSPVITAYNTQDVRYVPSNDGCDPSEYRLEKEFSPSEGSIPVSFT